MIRKWHIALMAIVALLGFANGHKPVAKLHPYQLVIPKGWPKYNEKNFAKNPLTQEGIALGRKLFYDGQLSKDGNFPCASCHQQFASFATFDHDFSHGYNNAFTMRNAPVLVNLAWMNEMHWDGGISHIEVQPLAPLTATNEMAETLPNVLQKLRADTSYRRYFKNAFGDTAINSGRMLKAIAQFIGSIQSYQSKYDQMKEGKVAFNPSEAAGYQIFLQNCNSCHREPLFTDFSYRNIGLPENPRISDKGRMRITLRPEDSLKFKVPTLRNITLSSPYMHDGRFLTLSQVFDHYRVGINVKDVNVDTLVINGIPLNGQQRLDLLSFLHTLRDDYILKNKAWSAPN
jgi:cytochrome c peroxidase